MNIGLNFQKLGFKIIREVYFPGCFLCLLFEEKSFSTRANERIALLFIYVFIYSHLNFSYLMYHGRISISRIYLSPRNVFRRHVSDGVQISCGGCEVIPRLYGQHQDGAISRVGDVEEGGE